MLRFATRLAHGLLWYGYCCILWHTYLHTGTEPKLKYYLEVAGTDPEASAVLADKIEKGVADELIKVEESGLSRPQVH